MKVPRPMLLPIPFAGCPERRYVSSTSPKRNIVVNPVILENEIFAEFWLVWNRHTSPSPRMTKKSHKGGMYSLPCGDTPMGLLCLIKADAR